MLNPESALILLNNSGLSQNTTLSFEDDNGIAKNLLNIRNSSRWEADMSKDDPTVLKCFEPKFYQVFLKYCESVKQTVHTSSHLMSVCLENLIPFCCWARENNSRISWIKNTLDDNIDLRPEVRNGLSMILIYALATAKAATGKDLDMFSALQDGDYGLGIVNKTSLKIYNDPFFFYGFLKSCMSGLIDAGKVPENERQNQPKKPKRQSDNKEELVAFLQMKNVLVSMFNRGENVLARNKVQQICTVWQERHKNIRNNWFTTALAILSAPNNLKQKHAAALGGSLLSTSYYRPIDTGYSSLLPHTAVDTEHQGVSSGDLTSVVGTPSSAYHQIDPETVPLVLNTSSSILKSLDVDTPQTQSSNDDGDEHLSKSIRSILSTGPSYRLFPSIPAMRFERVGAKEWECKESKIYNIESLVLHNSSVFCLVDEARLSAEERAVKKVKSQSAGFVSLHAELQQRGALVTSWPKSDHNHMLDFLEGWLAQETEVPMTDFWLHHSMSGGSSNLRNGAVRGKGVVVYEVMMQVGIVLRKNEALGISEDCWRLIYPRDLEAETLTVTLGAFLASFFPQLRSVFAKLSSGAGGSDLGNVVVKYFPHKIEPPVTQAPRNATSTAYQTIGTLDEPCINILARFDTTNLSFHDLVLALV